MSSLWDSLFCVRDSQVFDCASPWTHYCLFLDGSLHIKLYYCIVFWNFCTIGSKNLTCVGHHFVFLNRSWSRLDNITKPTFYLQPNSVLHPKFGTTDLKLKVVVAGFSSPFLSLFLLATRSVHFETVIKLSSF